MISVAMIVKNEEAHLERCLKSVEVLKSEIVIVDTGSTDSTIEIAEKFTKNIYHQKWQDDFSLHRNYSFSKCKGDWIIQIDADEELIFDDKVHPTDFIVWLHQLSDSINAVGLPLKDWRESKGVFAAEIDIIRIFRSGKVKYRRRIHNEPMYENDPVYFSGMHLKHYGYDLTPEQEKEKAERTIGLLLKSIEDELDDYQSYFYLAQAYASWGNDPKKAVRYAKKYVEHKNDIGKSFNMSIYYFLATRYFLQNDIDNCGKWINEGMNHDRQTLDLDLSYIMMLYGGKIGRGDIMAKGATGFVLAYENFNKIRLKQVGKFYFRYDTTSYVTALYHLVLYHLGNGSVGLKKIKECLSECLPEARVKIEQAIKDELKKIGLKQVDEKSRIILPGQFKADPEHIDKIIQASN